MSTEQSISTYQAGHRSNPYLHKYHQIGDGRLIHARGLAIAIAKARSMPDSAVLNCTLGDRGGFVRDFKRQVTKFFSSEIDRRAGTKCRGRKDNDDWFFSALRLAAKVNSRVICRVNECPLELRSRLAHRLM